jgi:5-methylthioadenosine/S-adenosylhomocysteine deaminase
MSILIKGGCLVTMNPQREVIWADILISGDRITGIGDIPPQPGDQVVDARGMLIIPGLIQTHIHLCQTLFRGMADDLELLDWLNLRILPLESCHDEESLYYSSLLACAELLRGGTTAVIDMATVRHTDSVFAAVERSGIRYLGGKCMMDHGEKGAKLLSEDTDIALQQSLDLLQRWNGQANGRLRYAFCPRFVPSCSQELLKQIQALSTLYQVPVHTHASENKSEIMLVESERGKRNIIYLDELGLCNERLILAHCIHLSETEQHILAASQTNVSHCPSSNLKLASGFAPIPALLSQGAHLSLGADGAPCNNNLSIFMEMRLAALIHKPFHGPTVMPALTVFEMATLGGARALGMAGELGSLEVGKKADIAVVDLNHWHTWPDQAGDVYAQLVYQVQTSDVYCTIVDGHICMLGGEVLAIPGLETKQKSLQAWQRVAARAGIL